jgi:hypothetical protein
LNILTANLAVRQETWNFVVRGAHGREIAIGIAGKSTMHIKKIVFTTIAASSLVFVWSASQAQQAGKVYRVGMLSNWGPGPVF